MNPTAIYSKSGKGVQEAAGKTSLLKRPDRAVLSAIDGRASLGEVAQKVGRSYDAAFQAIVQQLDKDGFIREVSAGAPGGAPLAQPSRPAPARPAAKPAASLDPASDLDFSSLGTASRPAPAPQRPAAPPAPKPAAAPPAPPAAQVKAQQSALDKAREEAEAKAAADRERVRREAEDKAKAEIEAKMRADAEKRMKEEAEARIKAAAAAEAEAKVRAAREAALRAAAEAKAKAEAEAKAKAEAERKAEEERRAREEMARRLEEERKAREEAERKAKEEAERARREAEEKARREAEELRQRLEAERKARLEEEAKRQEAERKAKEEAERARREAEEKARREAEELRQRLEAERKARLEEEAKRQEAERKAKEQAAQAAAQAAISAASPEPAAAKGDSFADSLLADLDSFTHKDEDERKAALEEEAKRQEAERAARAETERERRADAERAEREAAQAARRQEEEGRRREEEKRRAREEEERLAREEERRKREAEEIRRKAEAATAAAMAKQAAEPAQDIPISDDDLDMDEVKEERKALGIDEKKERQKAKEAEREAKRKKRADEKRRREAEKQAARAPVIGPARSRRSSSWGRPVALFLVIALLGAIVAAHLVPLDVAPYEQAASQALGRPVRIESARLWLLTGVQLRFDGVRIGDARIGRAVTHPALGSFLGEQKQFDLIELEGVRLPQAAFGEALFTKVKGERFAVSRIVVRNLDLPGGLALPKLDADISLDGSGALRTASLRGPDGLNARIVPRGEALDFEATAAGFPLPIGPDVVLSQFAMKGSATRQGLDIAEWGGAIFNGGISGTARVRWGSTWDIEGVLTVRSINAAVFAPALLSQGNAEGTGRFSMASADPAKLLASSRLDGRFTISKGTLGSFDLARAIQTRGRQAEGTTQFAELTGQGSYDHGTVALRNVTIGAGALNAGASADISKSGALSGRIVADVKTAAQTLSATLNLGGTVKEPQVRD